MSKRRFIQALVVRTLPALEKLPDTIRYAEAAWEQLTQHGYGAEQASRPRESIDWYEELNPMQKAGFDAFWIGFGYKKGKNDAAMRWHQLGTADKKLYQQIIDAARKEAARVVPDGQVRKMAAGWLFEKRWQDHQIPHAVNKNAKVVQLANLKNELIALEKLYAAKPNQVIQQQIDALTQQITALRGEMA